MTMPFEGGLQSTPNGTLLLSVAAAVIYCIVLDARQGLMRSAIKTAAVALLALLSVLQGGPLLLIAALGLSAVGDAFLSRDGDRWFLAGLASFLAAHVAYATLFFTQGGGLAMLSAPLAAFASGVLALTGFTMLALLWRRVGPVLRLPILAYAVTIAATGVFALTTGDALIVGGAALLIAGDVLLAVDRFLSPSVSPHRETTRRMSWAAYYTGQLAVALALLSL